MATTPPRIVVIEDSHADIRLFRYALDETGEEYTLEVLTDGEAALMFVRDRAAISDPCVILLDLHLPKYDGIVILSAIRKNPKLDHVKVVVMTTVASPQEESAIHTLGCRLYREKPRDIDDLKLLAQEIMRICHEHPLTSSAAYD